MSASRESVDLFTKILLIASFAAIIIAIAVIPMSPEGIVVLVCVAIGALLAGKPYWYHPTAPIVTTGEIDVIDVTDRIRQGILEVIRGYFELGDRLEILSIAKRDGAEIALISINCRQRSATVRVKNGSFNASQRLLVQNVRTQEPSTSR